MKKFKNIIIYALIFTFLFPIFVDIYVVYAADIGEKKVVIKEINGKQFALIAVTGHKGSSGIRYRTKGWWIQASFGGKSFPEGGKRFYTDNQLDGSSGDMVVYLPISDIYQFLGVTEEYYRQGGTVRFDAGQIIVYNGQETQPIYDSFTAINNGIRQRYGVSWSSSAQRDLRTYYNHVLKVKPEIDLDYVEATHVTTDGKILDIGKEFPSKEGPHTIYAKQFDGYTCIDPESGQHVVEIERRPIPKKHEVKFIYETGELRAVITGDSSVDFNEEFELSSRKRKNTHIDWNTICSRRSFS